MLLFVVVLALAGCGDPARSVVIVNQSDTEVIVGLEPRPDYAPDDVSVGPGKTRIAFAGSATAQGEQVTLWTKACEPLATTQWTTDGLLIFVNADLSTRVSDQSEDVGGVVLTDAERAAVACSMGN